MDLYDAVCRSVEKSHVVREIITEASKFMSTSFGTEIYHSYIIIIMSDVSRRCYSELHYATISNARLVISKLAAARQLPERSHCPTSLSNIVSWVPQRNNTYEFNPLFQLRYDSTSATGYRYVQ